jgi:RNA polymerase sigma factor (sigma-70 family)
MRRGPRYLDGEADATQAPFACEALTERRTAISIEERLTVAMAIEELSERERIVVLGTYVAGLSQQEIAATIGRSQSQVSKILGRALEKLQQRVA